MNDTTDAHTSSSVSASRPIISRSDSLSQITQNTRKEMNRHW